MNQADRRYRPDIDGLRALAVVNVLIFHAFPGSLPGGFVGVDVFFVISGYLISGIILDAAAAGRFSYADFYARRMRRIFPALGVMLCTALAAGWFLLYADDYARLGHHAAAGAAFASNFAFWQEASYFDVAAGLKRPRLSYNVAIFHRSLGASTADHPGGESEEPLEVAG